MNIYMCQFGNKFGDNVFLPYSIGCIIAYCKKHLPNNTYNMLYIKENIDIILSSIHNPDIVAFSSYIWNHEYNLIVAKEIKKKYPYVKIVFGGHNINSEEENLFILYPFIDYVVNGEGEYVFCELLKAIEYDLDIEKVCNLTINSNQITIHTLKRFDLIDIDEIPSPYLEGIFNICDGLSFTASLETNRGCPYGCAYCDWGSFKTSTKKMRKFNIDRVFKEIEWFGKNKIDFIFGCDSNFGIFPERDNEIIDKIIETKKKYSYPNKFRVAYAKNSDENVFNINKKLNEYDLSKGATLSFQSMNEATMKSVGRKNITTDTFRKYIQKYNNENIPVYTEMIIGLPEETYETWKNGLDVLLENHQHNNIVVYYCQIYPNSKINDVDYRKKYGIVTKKITMFPAHTIIDNSIYEKEEIIIGTNALSSNDWIYACMYSIIIQTFHILGLTQLIAIHMKYTYDIKYQDFYQAILYEFLKLKPNSNIKEAMNRIKMIFENIVYSENDELNEFKVGFKFFNKYTGNLNWTLEEGLFLECISNIDLLYLYIIEIIYNKYASCFKTKKDLTILKQIVKLNKHMINIHNDCDKEMNIDFEYIDIFKKYFKTGIYDSIFKFEKKQNIIIPTSKKYKDFNEYAINTIWYARKAGKILKKFNDIQISLN